MSWTDNPGSFSTVASELAKLLPSYTATKLAMGASLPSGLWDKVPVNSLAQHNGITATFPRLPDIAPISAYTYLTEGANPTETDLGSGAISVTVAEKGGVVAPSSLGEKTTVSGTMQAIGDCVAKWATSSMETWAQALYSPFLYQYRVDSDATYQGDSVMTTGAGRTVITDTSSSTNHWTTNMLAGGTMTITDPFCNCFGESCLIASNIQDTSITVSTNFNGYNISGTTGFSAAPIRIGVGTSVGVKYHVCVPTGITTGDSLTLTGVRYVQRYIRGNGCFGPGYELPGGGFYICMDSMSQGELQESLITALAYKDSDQEIRNYPDGGRIAGCNPILTAFPFRTAVTGAGTAAASGVVKYNQIFSPLAMEKCPIQGSDIRIYAKGKETGGTSNPLERYSTTGWDATLAGALRNGAWGASLLTYQL